MPSAFVHHRNREKDPESFWGLNWWSASRSDASARRRDAKKTWRRRAVDASFEKSFLFRVKFSNQYANFVEDLERSYQENFSVRAGHGLGTPAGRSRWLFKKKKIFCFFLIFFEPRRAWSRFMHQSTALEERSKSANFGQARATRS